MIILIREFQTPDEEMKKIVLKVVAQCVATEGVEPDYIRQVNTYNIAQIVVWHSCHTCNVQLVTAILT